MIHEDGRVIQRGFTRGDDGVAPWLPPSGPDARVPLLPPCDVKASPRAASMLDSGWGSLTGCAASFVNIDWERRVLRRLLEMLAFDAA